MIILQYFILEISLFIILEVYNLTTLKCKILQIPISKNSKTKRL